MAVLDLPAWWRLRQQHLTLPVSLEGSPFREGAYFNPTGGQEGWLHGGHSACPQEQLLPSSCWCLPRRMPGCGEKSEIWIYMGSFLVVSDLDSGFSEPANRLRVGQAEQVSRRLGWCPLGACGLGPHLERSPFLLLLLNTPSLLWPDNSFVFLIPENFPGFQ